MSKKKPSDYLTPKELDRFFNLTDRHSELGKRDYALLKLLYFSGARSSELARLKRKDFRNIKQGVKIDILGKGKKYRYVIVKDPDTLEAITAYWKKIKYGPGPEDPIFLTVRKKGHLRLNGIQAQDIGYCVKRYVKKAGINKNITPHSFRHSCLTHMLKNGIDIDSVRVYAGHSDISTTGRYLHTEEKQLERAAEALVLPSK